VKVAVELVAQGPASLLIEHLRRFLDHEGKLAQDIAEYDREVPLAVHRAPRPLSITNASAEDSSAGVFSGSGASYARRAYSGSRITLRVVLIAAFRAA
jgi:hypothetical protein